MPGLYGNSTLSALNQALGGTSQKSVNTEADLPTTSAVDTIIYVKSTTSLWQRTESGWVDTEADVKNQNATLLTPLEI